MPEAVKEIARRLESAGYETWAVGGAVREALAPEPTARPDWDLATAAEPAEVRKLFRPSYPIGIPFGTVGVRGSDDMVYEVTTFRRDISTDGRHAVIEYADTIDEDLARRDFTINAIAYHPLRDEIRDPYSGRDDLRRGILRCVGEPALRFAEDYLRALRGIRFAARYGLEIDPPTWEALQEAVQFLPRLSAERVREELMKVLAGLNPAASLELYHVSGTLTQLLPELARLPDDLWTETLGAVRCLPADQSLLRLAALLAPAASEVETIMRRLKFSNAEIREGQALTEALESPLPQAGDAVSVRRWLRRVSPERAESTILLQRARAEGRGAEKGELATLDELQRQVSDAKERGDAVTVADLAINGDDLIVLGLKPGPEFTQILGACLDAVVEDPELNERSRLLELVRERHSSQRRSYGRSRGTNGE